MPGFQPDYQHVVDAARNRTPRRLPLYEHIISEEVMEEILGKRFLNLYKGDGSDREEFFKTYVSFFLQLGYDTVSFERTIGPVMPGSGALGGHKPGVIKTREDFQRYPWQEIPNWYFGTFGSDYELLRAVMPPGMKAIGGPGNGVFELVQDVVGFEQLCYIRCDDPELYSDLFKAVGNTMHAIWTRFLEEYGDVYAVCRFGDDLGFKTATLLPPDDIRSHIIPQYKRIVDLVHSHGKPFLLHSCGNIFPVMDDLIEVAGIDAKHSNEDVIAPFRVWLERYGSRIGNFGGIDMDVLCQYSPSQIQAYVLDVLKEVEGCGGVAIGTGNSIPDYVPPAGYLAMIDTVRRFRGE